MKKLLRIEAIARTAGSHSRELADFFIELWMAANPNAKVLVRGLSDGHVPHLSQATIEGFKVLSGAPPSHLEPGVQLSDTLISELQDVDVLLISSPLYNFGSPSSLKALIDHVVRDGHTFEVSESGEYLGLLRNRKAYIIIAKSSQLAGTPDEYLDHQTPFLRAALKFFGIADVQFFTLEGTDSPLYCTTNKLH